MEMVFKSIIENRFSDDVYDLMEHTYQTHDVLITHYGSAQGLHAFMCKVEDPNERVCLLYDTWGGSPEEYVITPDTDGHADGVNGSLNDATFSIGLKLSL